MIKIESITHVGLSRTQNEDSFVIEENKFGHRLMIVADGMGGHNAGEVASKLVCDIIREEFLKIELIVDYKKFIETVIVKANQEVYKQSLLNAQYSKMGTTVTMVVYDNQRVYTGHIGDSRLYFVDKNNIIQITKDHTLVQAMVEAGTLKPEEVEHSKLKNVLIQALGTSKNITIEIKEIKLPHYYSLLICSDGLSGPVKNEEIKDIINLDTSLEDRLELLVNRANQIDGGDNVTVIVMENRSL
jgi:serine/threonine protein phosphatase PrpC